MKVKNLLKKTIICVIIIIFVLFIFLKINESKKMKIGNTMSSQEIVNYILNIGGYEVITEIEVSSNRNTNKYVLKQKYKRPNISEQEVLEPENIQGVKITKTENELKLENSKLNISKIYNQYAYMMDNCIDLNTFIDHFNKEEKKEIEENENEIILSVKNNNNPYTQYSRLYINKETGKPTKMEIKDNSKKTIIYILYKEVKFID